jgi:O-antigen/teichoic acid export membrane protein
MLLILLIGLYTSRVVLNVLGVEDFGVYEVVGGVVAMFSILSSSLSTAISRFITFSLGKDNQEESTKIYSSAIVIQVMVAVGIAVLIEIIGVWYLNHKINLPPGRLDAAFWVLQCSIVTFGLGLINVPFEAEIVAHEDMKIFAYFSILDAVIALLIVLLLRVLPADKLIVYAILNLAASLLMRVMYGAYCIRHYQECRFTFHVDKGLLKEVGTFTGWHLLGESAWIINNQGVSLLVNSYFGVTMNAARGIATKMYNLTNKFSASFMTALSPQITKTYAEGDLKAMHSLIFRGTKLSYFLMLLLAIPILAEAPMILRVWLKIVPDNAVLFTRLSIISALILVLGTPLVKAQLATGDLKRYQIVVSSCSIGAFPLTWIAYRLGLPAEWSYHIFNLIYFIILFLRIYLVKDLIDLPWKKYVTDVYLRVLVVSLAAAILPFLLSRFQQESMLRLIEVTLVSFISVGVAAYTIGLNREERGIALNYIRKFTGRETKPSTC